ncbi:MULTISPECIES: hypothetical protein [unclassified Sphingomonas]|jgi:hypothetical protein|nr:MULTISPECIES: hypothetical protein [unclassified Sphingomonas]KQM97765.1 hypothetical protein ASE77_18300 [Sphingomonas sp. Leaf226]KQN04279.1 hypothetical protein ASE82_18635 [Sphingomonas sp. Leaf230]VXD06015.1 conserved exported hypothetical protein [Sphingomonas sp. T1]
MPLCSKVATLSLASMMALSACSEQSPKMPPTEQETHARDSAVTSGTPGRHLYRCDDDQTLLVDFKDQGLTIELRRDASAPAAVLTAPLQGLQYVGDAETATFSGNQIKVEAPGKRPMLCQKATQL